MSIHHKQIGKYIVLGEVARGGLSIILKVASLQAQSGPLAIKVLAEGNLGDRTLLQMFKDEINISMSLQHPGLLRPLEAGEEQGLPYLVTEFIEGSTIKDLLKERGPFPIDEALRIVIQICEAVHYLHTKKILHRDLSPHNIMLTSQNRVKVIDFGNAKAESNLNKTQPGTIKGKLSYIAPEYLDGDELTGAYDQFCVGLVLWELLCARKHFDASSETEGLKLIRECRFVAPAEVSISVPLALESIIKRTLSPRHQDRYPDLMALASELQKIATKTLSF